MFELIRANQRKSAWLIAILGGVLMLMGYLIGFMVAPEEPAVSGLFVLIAVAIWIGLMLTSLLGGEKILLASAQAKQVEKTDAPQLHNLVEEMCIASGLSPLPKIYIIDSPDPNAFAVGLKPERAAVAVTTGLLGKLNRDELQGVIAHEVAHIKNRDTLFMTMAGVTVGAIIILGELFWRSMIYGSGRSRGRRDNNGGAALLVIAIVLAILAPLLARLLYLACSRQREYLADACEAQYTRFPAGLASALDKIAGPVTRKKPETKTSQTLAPMYIINPMAARSKRAGWFSTHPPTDDRIKVLRSMSSEASLAAYEQAYEQLHGQQPIMPASALQESTAAPVREAAGGGAESPNKQWREAQDLLHKVQQYGVLACACGMKMKLPPDFDDKAVTCPRCGTQHALPADILAAMAAATATRPGA
jgi:heat shock protein HtpX